MYSIESKKRYLKLINFVSPSDHNSHNRHALFRLLRTSTQSHRLIRAQPYQVQIHLPPTQVQHQVQHLAVQRTIYYHL